MMANKQAKPLENDETAYWAGKSIKPCANSKTMANKPTKMLGNAKTALIEQPKQQKYARPPN